jgi:hypothetical protein
MQVRVLGGPKNLNMKRTRTLCAIENEQSPVATVSSDKNSASSSKKKVGDSDSDCVDGCVSGAVGGNAHKKKKTTQKLLKDFFAPKQQELQSTASKILLYNK